MRSRSGLVILLALSALGATCKGADSGNKPPSKAATPTKPVAAPEAEEEPAFAEIPGIDIHEVPPAQRGDFLRILNETFCYCGCPRTLAACLSNKKTCSCVECSARMTKFIRDHFSAGMPTVDIENLILEGVAEGYNGPKRDFDSKDHAAKGTDAAAYTLVEFADFRCGHCKEAHPVLSKVAQTAGIKLVFHYYPLGGNDSVSMMAAEAAEEARVQGKFWPMADELFENQLNLDRNLIMQLGAKVGLDAGKLKKALDTHVHRDKILADKKAGQAAGVVSTPTIFINGRRFGFPRTFEYFMTRLSMEAERGRCR